MALPAIQWGTLYGFLCDLLPHIPEDEPFLEFCEKAKLRRGESSDSLPSGEELVSCLGLPPQLLRPSGPTSGGADFVSDNLPEVSVATDVQLSRLLERRIDAEVENLSVLSSACRDEELACESSSWSSTASCQRHDLCASAGRGFQLVKGG